MTVAERAREAAREHPFLLEALRAGVVNYTAAARYLDVGDEEAVATALRRFAADLPDRPHEDRRVRVTMESGLGVVDVDHGGAGRADAGGADPLLTVGDAGLVPAAGDLTGVLATGAVDAVTLAWVLDRLLAADVAVEAAGVAGDGLFVVAGRRDGADALRIVEDALAGVPTPRAGTG